MSSELNSSAAYWDAAQSDNLHFHYHPHAIAYPNSQDQVVEAVRCASKDGEDVAVSARSGGHSFAGFGSGGQDGSLVIDLGSFEYTHYNAADGTADIGPATRLGDVAKDLFKDGRKRGMPHGTCPAVGVGGHALCGGFGPTSRKWGMVTDNIVSADLVLANGTTLTVDRDTHPEIMWGLRGAGSNFGIVTNFKFQTYDASGNHTFLVYSWVESIQSGHDLAKLVAALQEFAMSKDLPLEMGFHIQIQAYRGNADSALGALKVVLRSVYMGPKDEYLSKVAPKIWERLDKAGSPRPDTAEEQEVSYLGIVEGFDDFGSDRHKLDTVAERKMRNNFVARTQLTMDTTRGFTAATLESVFDRLHERARTQYGYTDFVWNVFLEMWGGGNDFRHGQADVAAASSFPHRNALWLIQSAVGTWGNRELTDEAFMMLEEMDSGFSSAMSKDGIQGQSFPCYVDAALGDERWKSLLFGANVDRLEKLKLQLDPHNRFRNPQGLTGSAYRPNGVKDYEKQLTMTSDKPIFIQELAHPLP